MDTVTLKHSTDAYLVLEWDGRYSTKYDRESRLLTIGTKTRQIPAETDAGKQEILLHLACNDSGMHGIDREAHYKPALFKEGFRWSGRCMESAQFELNKDIEEEFAIRHFIRTRAKRAVIVKKHHDTTN